MFRVLALVAVALFVASCSKDERQPAASRPAADAVRIVATKSSARRGDYTRFHSEKELYPPAVSVDMGPAKGTSPGLIFLTPRAPNPERASGPTIVDSQGRVRWFLPRPGVVTSSLEAQTLGGKRVLTWGERPPVTAPPEIFKADPEKLYFVVADQNYKQFLRVRMIGEGVGTDMHEFVITKQGTALLIGFKTETRDLTAIGGTAADLVVDGIVQEIDLSTGKLLLNWSALEHVPVSDSMFPLPKSEEAWDAYHPNSVSVAPDGNLLVSMRHTSAIYKIDRSSGKVMWTLGGKSSDFALGSRERFYFQHDAQALGGGRVLLFDNAATYTDHRAEYSRVMILKLDGARRRATLVREIVHEPAILAVSQGNARRLANGNIFVGWGNREWFSEYTAEGQQLFDASVPSVAYQSYRALKGRWTGKPKSKPKVVADRVRGRTLIWASWNGATEVRRWEVLGGPSESTLRRLGTGDWLDFETRLDVAATPRVIRVRALDRDGKVLGTSAAVRPGGG